ncbi:MAG: hypothetical protein KVP17_004608 [Porospora cf. gigantea B]|uniref:uncharacterized protein n=1 Tax=Porospora cf. gigantea B TaxID=2853592 RepID=UPI00357190DE|nr:MAG: hypothetical protein KVP17_004608 [Porospora cf. gigantea B]
MGGRCTLADRSQTTRVVRAVREVTTTTLVIVAEAPLLKFSNPPREFVATTSRVEVPSVMGPVGAELSVVSPVGVAVDLKKFAEK